MYIFSSISFVPMRDTGIRNWDTQVYISGTISRVRSPDKKGHEWWKRKGHTSIYFQYYCSVCGGHKYWKNWDTRVYLVLILFQDFVNYFYFLKVFLKYWLNSAMSQTVRKKPKVFGDGFKYVVHKVNVTGTIQYWRCQQFRSCHGRAISEVGSFDIRPTQPHNHPPVEEVGIFFKLKLELILLVWKMILKLSDIE